MISVSAMEADRGQGSTSAELGEIVIATDEMLTPFDATRLRDNIDQALDGAVEEAERMVAADEAAADSVLIALRGD